MSSVTLTGNFLATARCLTFSDSAGIAWSFNTNTNTLVPSLTGAGIVSAVDGTAGQIDTSTVGSVVTVSIDAGYIGQTSITTLGTITTGTWEGTAIGTGYLPASQTQLTTAANLVTVGTITTGVWDGTTIAIAYGGTGQTTAAAAFAALSPLTTAGDLLYETTAPAPGRLPIGANTYILTSNGTVPVWTAPPVIPTGANPTGTVGLSAVNGSATTFLRSDGAPALSQAIVPTWTGTHTFTASSGVSVTINGGTSQNALNVNGSAGSYSQQITGSSTSGQSYGLLIEAGTTSADVGFSVDNQGATINLFRVRGDGLVFIPQLTASTGTTLIESGDAIYSLTSSRDYKVGIEDANEAALANVLKLRPRWYRSNPKTTSDRPDFSWYGLIAEEVHEIDPRLVNYWDQGRGATYKSKAGKETVVRPVQMKPKSVGYERIAPLLIPHINRLYARIEALEAKLKEKSP